MLLLNLAVATRPQRRRFDSSWGPVLHVMPAPRPSPLPFCLFTFKMSNKGRNALPNISSGANISKLCPE